MTDVTERYAAPTASVVLEPPRTKLWRRSLWLMVLYLILSGGFYPAIWLLRRRRALNAIESAHKIEAWPPLLLIALSLGEFVLASARTVTDPSAQSPGMLEGAFALSRLAIGILVIVQMFFVKSILEDYLADQAGPDTVNFTATTQKLSGLMTFFLSVFYLQYIINRDIVGPRR